MNKLTLRFETTDGTEGVAAAGEILDAVTNFGELSSVPNTPGMLNGSDEIDGVAVSWRWQESDSEDAQTYQRIIDVYRSGLITADEMHGELFKASAQHVSPPKKDPTTVTDKPPTDQGYQLPKLVTVCAYRILPGDIVWGIEHDGGFHIQTPYTVVNGAIPIDASGQPAMGPGSTQVDLGPVTVTNSKLMLVQVR